MNRLSILFLAFTLCAGSIAQPIKDEHRCTNATALLFGSAFTLCASPELLRDTAIIKADDLIVKFVDGSYFFGKLITADMDQLPAGFDMRNYPEYALGLREPKGFPPAIAEKFSNNIRALSDQYGPFKPITFRKERRVVYLISGKSGAEAFVIHNDDADHIVQFGFSGVDVEKVKSILEGVK